MTAGGEEVAVLVHDPALLDEPALVESVRATAALVLENERLAAEVRSQLAEVRASRGRIVAAADAERRRIERNLHDGAQQRLVTLSVALGLEASRADGAAADVLSRAQDEVEQAIGELRELARGIHPTLLRDEGLQAAVEALARRAPIPVTVHGSGARPPAGPGRARRLLRRLRGAHERRQARLGDARHRCCSSAKPATLRVTVTDDGVGGARITAEIGPRRVCATDSMRSTRPCRSRASRAGAQRLRGAPMRVVIADDAPLIREGVARLLTENGVEVVAQVGDADALLRASATCARTSPSSTSACRPPTPTKGSAPPREIRSRYPARRSSSSRSISSPSTHSGSSRATRTTGYLMKERVGRVEQLLDAVQRVAAGECVVDRAVVDELLARRRHVDPLEELTPREREILALIAEGRSNQGICRALWLSPKTVETHIRGAFAKLGIEEAPEDNRRVLAVLAYLRR